MNSFCLAVETTNHSPSVFNYSPLDGPTESTPNSKIPPPSVKFVLTGGATTTKGRGKSLPPSIPPSTCHTLSTHSPIFLSTSISNQYSNYKLGLSLFSPYNLNYFLCYKNKSTLPTFLFILTHLLFFSLLVPFFLPLFKLLESFASVGIRVSACIHAPPWLLWKINNQILSTFVEFARRGSCVGGL